MKIKRMTASFGCLDGRSMELSGGLNILHAPNESGKSTWCAFVRTMLYGMDTAAREKQGTKPDKVKYAPWSGAAMSGSMELEHQGKSITLRRWTSKAGQPMQEFSAAYTGTEDPVPGLTADTAGETLTGVPRGVFERSAFIRQAGMSVGNSTELEKRINAIVSAGDEELSYTELDKQLRAWLRHRRSGKRGAIPETENEMTETSDRLRRIREASEDAMSLEAELEELRREREQAVEAMEEARRRQRKQALEEMSRSRAMIQRAQTARDEAAEEFRRKQARVKAAVFAGESPERAGELVEDCRYRAGELEKLARRMPPVWISYLLLGVSAVGLAVGALMDWAMLPTTVGIVALPLFAVVHGRFRAMQKLAEDTMEDRKKMLAGYGVEAPEELDGVLEEYEAAWEEMTGAKKVLRGAEQQLELAQLRQKEADQTVVSGLDFRHGDSAAARAGQAVAAIDERIDALKERRAQAEGRARALGDPMVLESALEEQQGRLEELNAQYEALALAIETLAEADTEMQSRFSPRLSKKAAEYFAFLTGGRYEEVTIAKDLSAKVRPSGDTVGRETDYLSEGAEDQLYLALRLAVCELALEGADCPMVLDDALVNFDEVRMARAMELIRKIAESRQVLLFTCHDREYKYLMDDPGVAVIPIGQGKAE